MLDVLLSPLDEDAEHNADAAQTMNASGAMSRRVLNCRVELVLRDLMCGQLHDADESQSTMEMSVTFAVDSMAKHLSNRLTQWNALASARWIDAA